MIKECIESKCGFKVHTAYIAEVKRDLGLTMYDAPRVCLKIAFRQMCVTICGKFDSNEGGIAGYVDRMRDKFPAKWGVQMAGMNFQTHSNAVEELKQPR